MSGPVRLVVRGLDGTGALRVHTDLGHGADPRALLAAAGWAPAELVRVSGPGAEQMIWLDFRVHRADGPQHEQRTGSAAPAPGAPMPDPVSDPVPGPPRREPGPTDPDERPVAVQRLAAYVVVRGPGGEVLLTELSVRTSRPGWWTLPGGGVDPGEEPAEAAVREVWEETGQRVDLAEVLDVVTEHWVGRSPSGRLEDFHAVRVVLAGGCAAPSQPVVHDAGGTTSRATWVTAAELAELPVLPWVRDLLGR